MDDQFRFVFATAAANAGLALLAIVMVMAITVDGGGDDDDGYDDKQAIDCVPHVHDVGDYCPDCQYLSGFHSRRSCFQWFVLALKSQV